MTRKDYEFAKKVYDKMFWMQVFSPNEMKQAYRLLFNAEPANVQQARGRVAAYFRYDVTPVFEDETISISNEGQSHQEDLGDVPEITDKALDEALGKPKRTRKPKKEDE